MSWPSPLRSSPPSAPGLSTLQTLGKRLSFFIPPPPGRFVVAPIIRQLLFEHPPYAKRTVARGVGKTCPGSCLHRVYHMIRNMAIHQRTTQISIKPQPPRRGACYESLWWISSLNYFSLMIRKTARKWSAGEVALLRCKRGRVQCGKNVPDRGKSTGKGSMEEKYMVHWRKWGGPPLLQKRGQGKGGSFRNKGPHEAQKEWRTDWAGLKEQATLMSLHMKPWKRFQ